MLLKIVLLGYSRGLISSRSIAAACRTNVLFMAVSGDSAPHFTTVAHFISSLGNEAQALFTEVLLVCDREGLIGRDLFAIDGVKLPSNASKAKSGTRADFEREAAKMDAAVQRMIDEQKARDADNEVLVTLVETGYFAIEEDLVCPGSGARCKGLRLLHRGRMGAQPFHGEDPPRQVTSCRVKR